MPMNKRGVKSTLLEHLRKTEVKIAVIGSTGTGKSTWINGFRGITNENHQLYASTAGTLTECTTEVQCYEFEDNPNLKLYDLPGAGTTNFPAKTYPKKTMMHKYDAFVLLTSNRFLQSDSDVANHIIKTGKPFYVARTFTDVHMDNFIADLDEKAENATSHTKEIKEEAEEIRTDLLKALEREGTQYKPDFIYLLSKSSISIEGWFPDNENLKRKILEDLPIQMRNALGLGLFCYTEEQVDEKVKSLTMKMNSDFPLMELTTYDLESFLSMSFAIFYQIQILGIDATSIKHRIMEPIEDFLVKVERQMEESCNDKTLTGFWGNNHFSAWLQVTLSKTPEETHKNMKIFANNPLIYKSTVRMLSHIENTLEWNADIAKCIVMVLNKDMSVAKKF